MKPWIIFFSILILTLAVAGCSYFEIFDPNGCVYCEELHLHYVTAPMCDGNAEEQRAYIDSIQIQGWRAGQTWLCEIR